MGLALAMLACGCTAPHESSPLAPSPEDGLAVYLASLERDDLRTVERVEPDGAPLFLASQPLVTDVDIRHADAGTSADGRPALVLEMTDGGAERVYSESDEYVGRSLAFLWRGRVVYAPRVHSSLSSKLMIVGGTDALPRETLDEIAARINR